MRPLLQETLSCTRRSLVAATLVFLSLAGSASAADDAPNIAAAADLNFVLPEVAALFEQRTGRKVSLSFGSSGIFRRQIAEGAPFQIFFSADESYADALQKEGRGESDKAGGGAIYAIGRIVLFVPRNSPIKADSELRDLAAALVDGRLTRLAIANPEHAPYGRAAREALQRAGLWQAAADKLVLGENAAQAARFAATGSVQAGILPYSLAVSPEMRQQGSYALIPADRHTPLRQKVILIRGAGETARQFFDFVQQPPARAIFERYGFTLPGGAK